MKQNSLYISNSERGIRKYILRVLSCIGMMCIASLILKGTHYLVNIDYIWTWSHFFWGKYYQNEQNIDNIFLGSSHVFCDIDPIIMDRELGENNWNMSNNGMRLNAAYSILKEVDSQNELKSVYLELFYWCSTNEDGETNSAESYFYNSMNTDYRHENQYNIGLQLTMSSPARYLDTFFPGVRYRQYLFAPYHILSAVKYERSEDYRNNIFRLETERGVTEYQDKGFWFSTIEMIDSERIEKKDRDIKEGTTLTGSAEIYLRKIIKYCKDEGIELVLFCSPMYDIQLLSVGDYDAYVNKIKAIADEYGISYYDFNLIKPEYMDIQHLEYYKDMDHLNTKGADEFSGLFADIIIDPSIADGMFYDSYHEKLSAIEAEVYGLYWITLEDGTRRFYIASNRDDGIIYDITVRPSGGEPFQIKVENEEKLFDIFDDSAGTIELNFLIEDSSKSGQFVINYDKE